MNFWEIKSDLILAFNATQICILTALNLWRSSFAPEPCGKDYTDYMTEWAVPIHIGSRTPGEVDEVVEGLESLRRGGVSKCPTTVGSSQVLPPQNHAREG